MPASILSAVVAVGLSSHAHAAPKTVTLEVHGMSCASCPIAVKKALTRVEGVSEVDVSFATKEATVTYDDARTEPAALITAVGSAGFKATPRQ